MGLFDSVSTWWRTRAAPIVGRVLTNVVPGYGAIARSGILGAGPAEHARQGGELGLLGSMLTKPGAFDPPAKPQGAAAPPVVRTVRTGRVYPRNPALGTAGSGAYGKAPPGPEGATSFGATPGNLRARPGPVRGGVVNQGPLPGVSNFPLSFVASQPGPGYSARGVGFGYGSVPPTQISQPFGAGQSFGSIFRSFGGMWF